MTYLQRSNVGVREGKAPEEIIISVVIPNEFMISFSVVVVVFVASVCFF